MMHSAIVIGLLSCFSAVFANEPDRNFLLSEVGSLKQLSAEVVKHINITAEAQIDAKLDSVNHCWTAKTAEFQRQINQMFQDQLAQFQLQLTNLRANVPGMTDDQITQLATQLFVDTDGLLEKAEDAIGAFNQDVKKVHTEVLKLNTIDCGNQ